MTHWSTPSSGTSTRCVSHRGWMSRCRSVGTCWSCVVSTSPDGYRPLKLRAIYKGLWAGRREARRRGLPRLVTVLLWLGLICAPALWVLDRIRRPFS